MRAACFVPSRFALAGLVLIATAGTAGPAAAVDEVLVVMPVRSNNLSPEDRARVSEALLGSALSMARDLEMDVLRAEELDRARNRWTDARRCRDLDCDLDQAWAVGAQILVSSEVTENRDGLLVIDLRLLDLRGEPKPAAKRDRRAKPKSPAVLTRCEPRPKKPRELGAGGAKMRSVKKLARQGAAGVTSLLEDAFFEPEAEFAPEAEDDGEDEPDLRDDLDREREPPTRDRSRSRRSRRR